MSAHTPPPYRAVMPGFNKHLWCRFIEDKDGNLIAMVRYANPVQSENEAIATADFLAHAATNHAPLVEAVKFLHDALSNILEGCRSPERGGAGVNDDPNYDYPWIHRDQRALALRAIRHSFRTLAKIPGSLE